ncbi:FtsX-like permease family protein [Bowdeniella nasicola]|nr:ABC transporter permease [Bowdeniella nasicola]
MLGLEAEQGSTALQDALAAGGGVEDPLDMHDGTAEIVSGDSENPDAEEAVRVPAARVDPYRLEALGLPMISERVTKAFGFTSHVNGYVVTPQHPITPADRTVIDAKLRAVSSTLHGAYAVPTEFDARLPLYLVLGGIILVAGVTILSVALSAAEMGQDFSVLRSLGITRRGLIRIGGLRAGIQAFVGVILGLIAGVGGYALYFLFSRYGIPFDSFVGQNLFEHPFTPDYVSWAHRVIVPFGHLALLALGVIPCAVIVGMILAPRSAQRPTATD